MGAASLDQQGTFCMVHAAPREPEVRASLGVCGFLIRRRLDIFFRGRRKSVAFACSLSPAATSTSDLASGERVEEIEVQRSDGTWSPEYIDLCQRLGLGRAGS